MVALHGATETASFHAGYAAAPTFLAGKDVLVAYPQGLKTGSQEHWNDGRKDKDGALLYPNKDREFIEALINKLNGDPTHAPRDFYLWGMSNGGMMAIYMTCNSSITFKGVAAVAALAYEGMVCDASKVTATRILLMHGKEDIVMPEGAPVVGSGGPNNLTLNTTAKLFCLSMPATTSETINRFTGGLFNVDTKDSVAKTTGCSNRVISLDVAKGGHRWFDGSGTSGGQTKEIKATKQALQFWGLIPATIPPTP